MAIKTKQLNVRVDNETAVSLSELEKNTDIDATRLVRHAIKAALHYWELNRELRLPLVCIPAKEYDALMAKLQKGEAKG